MPSRDSPAPTYMSFMASNNDEGGVALVGLGAHRTVAGPMVPMAGS
jgi:hypothetical protein